MAQFKSAVGTRAPGAYFLFGEEDYLKAQYLKMLRGDYEKDSAASLNYIRFEYKDDTGSETLQNAASSASFFGVGTGKLIEIDIFDMASFTPAQLDVFCASVENAAQYGDHIIVIRVSAGCFDYGTLPRRPSSSYQTLAAVPGLFMVHFAPAANASLCTWIEKHVIYEGLNISRSTCEELILRCGNKMSVIAEEIKKLCACAKANHLEIVTENEIALICTSSLEIDAFDLANAILERNIPRALSALRDQEMRRTEPVIVLGGIFRVISGLLVVKQLLCANDSPSKIAAATGMHEYAVMQYIKNARKYDFNTLESAVLYCRDADMQIKSTRLGYIALERLICSI